MRFLINATTLKSGGGLQVAVSLILESRAHASGHEWHYAVHRNVLAELDALPMKIDGFVVDESPARNHTSRRKAEAYIRQLLPDAVLTPHGPAYLRIPVPHLLGCNYGWGTVSTWLAFRSLPISGWAVKKFEAAYKRVWFRLADAWVTETEASRQGIHHRMRLPLNRIHVVANTCGSQYLNGLERVSSQRNDGVLRLLTFSAPYPHKRLEIIPDVAVALATIIPNQRFEFVITIPPEHPTAKRILARASKLGVSQRVVNRGPVKVLDGPKLYCDCDIAFVPSVLETFSASFPEAMAMGLPVVACDLDFAREVCGDAATYFRPNDAQDAAKKIAAILHHETLRGRLIQAGRERLTNLPDARQRYQAFVAILEQLVRQKSVSTDRDG